VQDDNELQPRTTADIPPFTAKHFNQQHLLTRQLARSLNTLLHNIISIQLTKQQHFTMTDSQAQPGLSPATNLSDWLGI